ncbi:MAG: rod-binding protein [Candidatus Aureabacteria bacterium]|nr:rod-binding protein [Candidatus Auribacterota bacterium]
MDAIMTDDYGMGQMQSFLDDSKNVLAMLKRRTNPAGEDLRNLEETPEGLKKVASAFESMFIHLLLKEMRKSLHTEDGIFPASTASEIWQDLLDEQTAGKMAEGGSVGISKMIVQSYEKSLAKNNQDDRPMVDQLV